MPIKQRKIRTKIGLWLTAAVFVLLVGLLVKTQLIEGDKYKDAAESYAVAQNSVSASRGEILGCNGEPLVTNRQGNSLIFKYAFFPSAKEQPRRNELIASLIQLFESNKLTWIDRLPIRYNAKGKLVVDKTKSEEFSYLVSDNMLALEAGEKATADECLDALIERYGLQSYDRKQARKIASVCFGMKYLYFSDSSPYKFAEDVPTEIVSRIMEQSSTYPGVAAETESYREYNDVTAFSHILGVVGSISAEEYERENAILQEKLRDPSLSSRDAAILKNDAYSLNDRYGKSGIEQVMESYLRGRNGIRTLTTASDGTVHEDYLVKPVQGNTVVTTIDPGLQKVCAEALADMLDDNRATELFPKAGGMVVLDVNSGAVLADVSLPTYDITRYFKDYDKLAADTSSPLWNRTLQSAYAPGSTMKPSVALAGLEEGVLNADTSFYCSGTYVVEDQIFGCLSSHGYLNVVGGLRESCNCFFYETGKRLGIDKMNKYGNLLGLGQATGIELDEAEGTLASIANKEANGEVWNPGDTVQAAIGQSDNLFTPLQLANYCATLANGGTRYKPFIIKSVLSSDMSEVLYETQPTVLNTLGVKQSNLALVREGMHEVVTSSGVSRYYGNCVTDPAGKTGTSQVVRETPGGGTMVSTNAFFITFAPYDKPEIAIAIVAENAMNGTRASQAAVPVYNYYFSRKTAVDKAAAADTLIP